MIGKFLEIGIHTRDIKESLDCYEALGFHQATVGEAWEHPYAVVSDGHLCLGLHRRDIPSPWVTFVRPALTEHIDRLEEHGVEIEFRSTGDERFNEAGFFDPDGLSILLVEARTFSPSVPGEGFSLLGEFLELSSPVRNVEFTRDYWQQMGWSPMDEAEEPVRRVTMRADGMTAGFYESRRLRQAVLIFAGRDMDARLAALESLGFKTGQGIPDVAGERRSATLETPEGMTILLIEGE